jgi:hypothetical protein
MRRRLLSIVGAIGLLTGLISSGVAAQASTPGPDWTYSSLLLTYLWSSQDVCYSNGAAPVTTNPCVIVQPTPAPGKSNIAVCVQITSATQQCDITQTNDTHNNYALVIQRINQQGTTASCSITVTPCQNGTQRASISQTDVSGSNFGGVIQKVSQSLSERSTDGDPQQVNEQDLQSLTVGTPGLMQTSATGSNFAAVGQDSQQYQAGATAQSQNAKQFAGLSESARGINQTTGAPGGNAALLGQVQKQNLQSLVALSQSETANQDGDLTQNDGASNQNFASGNQFQDQQEQGVSTTTQHQFGDPKCCSVQTSGGKFLIRQATNQFANNAALRQQNEHILGNCDSFPNGCTVIQTATLNGNTQPGDPCNAASACHQGITCATGGETVTPGCTPFQVTIGLRFSKPSFARRGIVASAALLT